MFKRNLKTDSTKMITFFYFFLLVYTIAALVWWGILLHQQNQEIMQLKIEKLELSQADNFQSDLYNKKQAEIRRQSMIRNFQYIGEGCTFLLIILLSAGFVYRAMRRQIRFSRQQQNFMLAVTHELKSPIAVLRLNLETLLKRKLSGEQQSNLLNKTLAETNRLNRLSNNMLLASRFESRQYHLMKEPLNLSELVQKLVAETRDRSKKYTITADIVPGIRVEGDALMLQIVCSNMLENAQKYAPDGSAIRINLRSQHKAAVLQFKDEGEGIPDAEKSKIFNRFYRIGNENTRRSQGTGLGLFLTKKIVLQHGGQIIVKNNVPKGSIFEITLPQSGK